MKTQSDRNRRRIRWMNRHSAAGQQSAAVTAIPTAGQPWNRQQPAAVAQAKPAL